MVRCTLGLKQRHDGNKVTIDRSDLIFPADVAKSPIFERQNNTPTPQVYVEILDDYRMSHGAGRTGSRLR